MLNHRSFSCCPVSQIRSHIPAGSSSGGRVQRSAVPRDSHKELSSLLLLQLWDTLTYKFTFTGVLWLPAHRLGHMVWNSQPVLPPKPLKSTKASLWVGSITQAVNRHRVRSGHIACCLLDFPYIGETPYAYIYIWLTVLSDNKLVPLLLVLYSLVSKLVLFDCEIKFKMVHRAESVAQR